MADYIKLFQTNSEYMQWEQSTEYLTPNVCKIEENNSILYNKYENEPEGIDYSTQYLTIESLEDDLDIIFNSVTDEGNTLEYRVDNGDLLMLEPDQNSEIIKQGQKIQVKGLCKNIMPSSGPPPLLGTFTISKKCNVSGNIMSLLYGDDFINQNEIPDKITFRDLFKNCTTIINSNNLILPATTLKGSCYYKMFYGCSKLNTAPSILPATKLANECYQYMFSGCTNLTTAPELPATTLANSCYYNMFGGCTSLTTAPELPATELTSTSVYCYYKMFYGCSKLNYIKMLASNIQSGPPFFSNWVEGVSSTGTFVKHPDMTSLPNGVSGIPEGWAVENA